MKPLPHHYDVHLSGGPSGYAELSTAGVPAIRTAPAAEYDGPGDAWSPEHLPLASVQSVDDNRNTASATSLPMAALLVVDVQNDFCAGGALPVPGSERVVTTLNQYIDRADAAGMAIYASRDWHPAITNHFAPYGGSWPVHCVQSTPGARFQPDLRLPPTTTIVTKGDQLDSAGYSAFEGRTSDGSFLLAHLQQRRINHLYVGGLATDYCVKHSVLDALAAGLTVTILEDAIAGVDVHPGDSARAISEMREKGANIVADAGSLSRHLRARPRLPGGGLLMIS